MTKLEEIRDATLNILKTCPTYQDKVYLLENFNINMAQIKVMYDSFAVEDKCIYLDKNGYYINGRSTSNEGKMYFDEFNGFIATDEINKNVVDFIRKEEDKLSTRIPSKDIKVGMVCRKFCEYENADYYIYLGKYLHHDDKKYHAYVSIYKEFALNEEDLIDIWWYHCENKNIRFDKICKTINHEQLNDCRNDFLHHNAIYLYIDSGKVGKFLE